MPSSPLVRNLTVTSILLAPRTRSILMGGLVPSVGNVWKKILCDPYEFKNIKRKNFKREEEFYLSEQPERLKELAEKG